MSTTDTTKHFLLMFGLLLLLQQCILVFFNRASDSQVQD